jgi:hypothetical protein
MELRIERIRRRFPGLKSMVYLNFQFHKLFNSHIFQVLSVVGPTIEEKFEELFHSSSDVLAEIFDLDDKTIYKVNKGT